MSEDVFEELLGDRVVLGEVADEHGAVAVLACERQHGLETVFPLASQHEKSTKSTYPIDISQSIDSMRPLAGATLRGHDSPPRVQTDGGVH